MCELISCLIALRIISSTQIDQGIIGSRHLVEKRHGLAFGIAANNLCCTAPERVAICIGMTDRAIQCFECWYPLKSARWPW